MVVAVPVSPDPLAVLLVTGVADHVAQIDELVAAHARDWSLGTEAQLLALIDRSFRTFDEHPELIKAMLHTRHGRAARLSENDQRRAMAERCVDDAIPGLDPDRRRQAAAATQLLFSAAAWEVLRDYWDMNGEEAAATASLALTAMLEGLRRSSTK